MANQNDKFTIDPRYAYGHDWEEFLDALVEFGLDKHTTQYSWSQISNPRTETWRIREDGPVYIAVAFNLSGVSLLGPEQSKMRFFKQQCRTCGRAMVGGHDDCRYCRRDHERKQSADRSRRYRQRHGLVKHLPIQQCAQCGWLFEPKRSTARFCSSTCRVKAHRIKVTT